MAKKVTIIINDCLDCPFCSEGNSHEKDQCFHRKNPNGEDCTVISNVNLIPIWCPLEDD